MRFFSKYNDNERAFTMIEIALSLAVVSFALVAIIGVLPTGMTVQKDNREDVIINQEGRYWLEAIKGGGRGIGDLSKYVEEISVTNAGVRLLNIVNTTSQPLTSSDIMALLSTPKSAVATNSFTVARVKAMTGPAAEKGPLTNQSSFRYQIRAEVIPAFPVPPMYAGQRELDGDPSLRIYNELVGNNLWEVRLVLRWPVVERGNGWHVGNNRKTFRARIAGRTQPAGTNEVSSFLRNRQWMVVVPNQFNG